MRAAPPAVGKWERDMQRGGECDGAAIGKPARGSAGLLFWVHSLFVCMQLYAGPDIKVSFSSCFFLGFSDLGRWDLSWFSSSAPGVDRRGSGSVAITRIVRRTPGEAPN